MPHKIKRFINKAFKDRRGYYWTSWSKGLIIKIKFKHDKFSFSKKNVLRGLHGDEKTWKRVSCPYGKFLLIVVNSIKKSIPVLKKPDNSENIDLGLKLVFDKWQLDVAKATAKAVASPGDALVSA